MNTKSTSPDPLRNSFSYIVQLSYPGSSLSISSDLYQPLVIVYSINLISIGEYPLYVKEISSGFLKLTFSFITFSF